MAGRRRLTHGDVACLLDLVEQTRREPVDAVFPAALLVGLRSLLPCDEAAFQLLDEEHRRVGGARTGARGTVVDLADEPESERFWAHAWAAEGAGQEPDRVSVQLDARASVPYARATRYRCAATVPLPRRDGVDRFLLLYRADGPGFGARELLLLRLVRPHLLELHDEQQRRVQGEPTLTGRQWQVLRQVARGASNAQVAHALQVSESTVRKHLEHAFSRLAVASRTEAVARVSPFLAPGAPVVHWGLRHPVPAPRSETGARAGPAAVASYTAPVRPG